MKLLNLLLLVFLPILSLQAATDIDSTSPSAPLFRFTFPDAGTLYILGTTHTQPLEEMDLPPEALDANCLYLEHTSDEEMGTFLERIKELFPEPKEDDEKFSSVFDLAPLRESIWLKSAKKLWESGVCSEAALFTGLIMGLQTERSSEYDTGADDALEKRFQEAGKDIGYLESPFFFSHFQSLKYCPLLSSALLTLQELPHEEWPKSILEFANLIEEDSDSNDHTPEGLLRDRLHIETPGTIFRAHFIIGDIGRNKEMVNSWLTSHYKRSEKKGLSSLAVIGSQHLSTNLGIISLLKGELPLAKVEVWTGGNDWNPLEDTEPFMTHGLGNITPRESSDLITRAYAATTEKKPLTEDEMTEIAQRYLKALRSDEATDETATTGGGGSK